MFQNKRHLLAYFIFCLSVSFLNAEQLCQVNKCGINGRCVIQKGAETCICSSGFVGTICQFNDPCRAHPCGTNGACYPVLINLSGREQVFEFCQCYAGYSGANCEKGNQQIWSNANYSTQLILIEFEFYG